MEYSENIKVAWQGLTDHKFRSFLTMLGIIFGVASVIAMLSIGEGAKREAIAKYQDLGVNNIIVREKDMSDEELEEVRTKFSPGLSLRDAEVIREIVPGISRIAAQAEINAEVKYASQSVKSSIIGVTPEFYDILNYKIREGEFITDIHYSSKQKICVLGAGIAYTLFQKDDPVGKMVKIEDQWLEVVGVLESKALFTETVGELAARDLNTDVYVPLSMFLDRFSRENVLESEIQQLTIQVENSDRLMETSALISEIVRRHHFNNEDYGIVIPLELLKQEEKERQIYNFLLGAIAAISLIVGGIGIMNIMLATVMERTREIGIRRAIGARKSDILGVSLSLLVSVFTDVSTYIRLYSVIIAFAFSVVVGVVFGYLPAKNAANLKPVDSIRYE